MAIDLIDINKYEFGSVAWQESMIHNINEKLNHKEELSGAERCFIDVQKEHNFKICKDILGNGDLAKKYDELCRKGILNLTKEEYNEFREIAEKLKVKK